MGELKPGPPQVIELLDDSSIRYFEHFVAGKPSLELYVSKNEFYSMIFDSIQDHLLEAIPWKEEPFKIIGETESYFTVWCGDQLDNPYGPPPNLPPVSIGSPSTIPPKDATSVVNKIPDSWANLLKDLKANVERIAGAKFNMLHLTYHYYGRVASRFDQSRYQDGTEYVAGQEDLSKGSKGGRCVATLTLGIDSRVKFTHRTKSHKHDLNVASGSLFVLNGE